MREVIKYFEANKIKYNRQEYTDNVELFSINEGVNLNLVIITNSNNTFLVDRDLFYYLDNQSKIYSFILHNNNENKLFYLVFKNKKNWLKSSFENTDKDEIYLGKIVLNNQYSIDEILGKLNYLVKQVI